MRAWRVEKHGEPRDALRCVELDPPEPGPGLLRVRTGAAALGLPDVFMCRGEYPARAPLPFTPGQELVGVVSAAGAGTQARVGDRILGVAAFPTGHGAFAEEALAIDAYAFPAPDELPDAEAAAFVIAYHTAWLGLVRRGALREGETLLVLGGSGGTGSAAILLGGSLGARVFATAAGTERAEFCRELGAEVAIDRRAEDVAERVRELTDGRGADVIFDPVGGEAFEAATRCVAHEGRILTVGFASGSWAQASTREITVRNYAVVGVMVGGYDRSFTVHVHEDLLARRRRGEIRVPIARVVPFDGLPAALEDLGAGRILGKAVLAVGR